MCAAMLHAVLIFGAARSMPRQMGEPDADPDALSVELVDAESLSKAMAPVREESPPAVAREAAQPVPESAAVRAQQPNIPWSLDTEALASYPPSDSAGAAAKGTSQQQRSGTSLQLNLPDTPLVGTGRTTSVGRPANITRSGENDEFGRGVVRALRRTMPSPTETVGRTTIRLFLSESGNLVDLALVRSSGDANLDQSVVFAAKQSSFPIPPVGSTVSDRTFLVTYIYP
jgi:TonB family protein